MMLKKYDPQLFLDFEAAEDAAVERMLKEGIPEGAVLGGPFEKVTRYKKPLRSPEHEKHVRETANRKRADTIRKKTQDGIGNIVEPEPLGKRAKALSEKMAALERRVHEGKERLEPLHADVRSIMEEIRGLGALLPQHGKFMDIPMDTPNYLHDEDRSTVADELFGAFEVYREILGNLETGMAKNGPDAVELQAKMSHEFLRGLIEGNRRKTKKK